MHIKRDIYVQKIKFKNIFLDIFLVFSRKLLCIYTIFISLERLHIEVDILKSILI